MIQLDNTVEKFQRIILMELNARLIKVWVAGGAVRDHFMGVPAKTDIDLFFPKEDDYEHTKAYFIDREAEVKWESENGMKVEYEGFTFDLVKHFFPDPRATIEAFDFTVSMFAVDSRKVYHGESSFIDLAKRQLMINKITYPASTMRRAFRYYTKGFRMCSDEMKKLAEALMRHNLEPISTEEENESSGRFFRGID